mgnify:CR=1 FL=1
MWWLDELQMGIIYGNLRSQRGVSKQCFVALTKRHEQDLLQLYTAIKIGSYHQSLHNTPYCKSHVMKFLKGLEIEKKENSCANTQPITTSARKKERHVHIFQEAIMSYEIKREITS